MDSIPLFAIEEVVDCDYDTNMPLRSVNRVFVGDLASHAVKHEGAEPFNSLAEIEGWIRDGADVPSYALVSEEEHEAREQEQERRELEGYVSALCARRGIEATNVGAILTALSEEEREAESRQYGMREDGLCIGMGCTPDQWFDEFNHVGAQGAKSARVFDWVARNAPLAYAQWEESRRAEDA